ncbi:hypothetical protein GS854_00835 [Rhodococcus hoagii]|nr:hypothetical protein [Prescottella equi]
MTPIRADEWTQEAGHKYWRETNLNILLVDEADVLAGPIADLPGGGQ